MTHGEWIGPAFYVKSKQNLFVPFHSIRTFSDFVSFILNPVFNQKEHLERE